MKLPFRELWSLAKRAVSAWIDDRAPSMGAALAYYTAFSLAPLLLIVISIAGLVFGEEAARGALVGQLAGLVGEQGGQAIQTMLEHANSPTGGVLGTLVGVVTLLIGATSVFVELQDDLDRIWKAAPRVGSGLWNFIRSRLLSFGMILGIGFLLMVSLVISGAIAALGEFWGGLVNGVESLLHALNFLVSFSIFTLLFAMIYKFLPNVKIDWDDVWIGAAATSLLFSFGKFLIGLYIGKSAVSSSFGAAGAFVVLLVWIYYSTQIFLLGAEFTYAYANRHGSRKGREQAEPRPAAVGSAHRPTPALVPEHLTAAALADRARADGGSGSAWLRGKGGQSRGARVRGYLAAHPYAGIGALASGGFVLGALLRKLVMQKMLRHL